MHRDIIRPAQVTVNVIFLGLASGKWQPIIVVVTVLFFLFSYPNIMFNRFFVEALTSLPECCLYK